jgi:HTH-type transcriptional regulator/antitoxin HipB
LIRTEATPVAVRAAGQLGPALKALRQARGWSQTELGRQVGLSQERISSIERHPERMTVGQLLTVLMALQAELQIAPRSTAAAAGPW